MLFGNEQVNEEKENQLKTHHIVAVWFGSVISFWPHN